MLSKKRVQEGTRETTRINSNNITQKPHFRTHKPAPFSPPEEDIPAEAETPAKAPSELAFVKSQENHAIITFLIQKGLLWMSRPAAGP